MGQKALNKGPDGVSWERGISAAVGEHRRGCRKWYRVHPFLRYGILVKAQTVVCPVPWFASLLKPRLGVGAALTPVRYERR